MGRAALVFARPQDAPRKWIKEQYRLARLPGFLEAHLATVRTQVGLKGQREVLVDRPPNWRDQRWWCGERAIECLPIPKRKRRFLIYQKGTSNSYPSVGICPTSSSLNASSLAFVGS